MRWDWQAARPLMTPPAISSLAVPVFVQGLALSLGLAALAGWANHLSVGARCGLTWDCGYARPEPRMQYTASSFAQMIVSLFGGVLRPHKVRPHVTGLFPAPAHTHSHVDDAVLHGMLLPAGAHLADGFDWFRRFHRGLVQHYLLYILIAVIALFVWAALGA